MKEIPLTRGYVALVDDEDYDRVSQHKWHAKVGIDVNYAAAAIRESRGKFRFTQLHRFVMGATDPLIRVDHIDRDGLNCRRNNLRLATHMQNSVNRKLHSNNTSGFKGVSITKSGRWLARIRIERCLRRLGVFDTAQEAALAYDAAAMRHFGEFARTNTDMGLLSGSATLGGR